MKKNQPIKLISLLMIVVVLISTFSLPVFAESGSSEAAQEEYTFWEDLAFFGVLVLGAILSPIIVILKGIEAIIQELAPVFAELGGSIVNFFV